MLYVFLHIAIYLVVKIGILPYVGGGRPAREIIDFANICATVVFSGNLKLIFLFCQFLFLSEEKENRRKKKKQVRTYHMSFLFSNIGTLQQCEERTFLQKRGAHACVFRVLCAVCYLCIHFYKNAHTHSHFRDIKCTFCGNFFVLGLDNVRIILKREHRRFPKENTRRHRRRKILGCFPSEIVCVPFSK